MDYPKKKIIWTVSSLIKRFNENIAVKLTVAVSSIWAFYAFVLYGLIPLIWTEFEPIILYWSNFLQLIFLPIITVGAGILGRASERRQMEDHKHITDSFKTLHLQVETLKEMIVEMKETHVLLNTTREEISDHIKSILKYTDLIFSINEYGQKTHDIVQNIRLIISKKSD